MSAPLTSAKLGSTRCVWCEKLFADDHEVRPVTTVEAEVTNGWGISSSGKAYRRLGTHLEGRRWHTDCLAEFERSNQESRERAEADRLTTIEAMRAAIEATA